MDMEFLNSDIIKENPNLLNDPNCITTIKTANEERRKKISGNDLIEKIKGDFKETLILPGEKPKMTAQSNYQNEYKTKLQENKMQNANISSHQTSSSSK